MPLYYKHDRRNELFPPITQGQHTPVLPVARVTRNDIESRLQISIETRKKVNQIYTTYHNERKRQPTPTLKSIPSLHLFPHDASSQQQSFTRTNHGNETGSLPLYKVPRFSLFQPLSNTPKAHSTSQPTPPPPTLLMLHTEQYAQQRRAMVDDQGNPCFVVDDSNNNSISSAATAVTFNTPQERSIPSTTTIPSQQQQQLVIPETPVTRTTTSLSSPSTFLESVRKQFVPILATSMQQQGCDKLAQLAQTRDGSFLKINFESMIGLLNHPLIALMDEYEETTADKWSGSGKTHFIKQLVDILRKENMPLKITIATYDIDTESFLFDCIRNHLQLPCLRIGSVLDDAWEREYGVIFQTLKTRESVRQTRTPDTDFIIAFDIRLGPDDAVFTKISNKRGSGLAPIIWLVTLGSVEDRVLSYFKNNTSSSSSENQHHWHHEFKWSQNSWWSDKQKIVLEKNRWPTAEEATPILQQAVESVISWARNGFSEPYQFPIPYSTPTVTEIPIITEISAPSNIPSTSSSSITASIHPEDQSVVPECVSEQQQQQRNNTPPVSDTTPPQRDTQVVSSDMDITEPSGSMVVPQPLLPSDSTSDMDIDSDQDESIDLPESVKAQIKQCFQYPTLQPVFERTSDMSRHSSPNMSHRQRYRINRWRGESNTNEEEDDEDEVASFYSASEFVQDLKPALMLIEPDSITHNSSNSNLATGNAISLKLNPLKEAYEKEYQAILSRIQSQYDQEMKSLQQKFERQAYEKLQNGL